MRESNISDTNTIQFSQYSSSRKDSSDDSLILEKQVQVVKKNEDVEVNLSSFNNSMLSVNKSINSDNEGNSKIINDKDQRNKNKDLSHKKSQIGNKANDIIIEIDKMNQLYLRRDKEKSEQKGYTVYEII